MRGQMIADVPPLDPVTPGGASHGDCFRDRHWKSLPGGIALFDEAEPGSPRSPRGPLQDGGDDDHRTLNRSLRDAKLLEQRRRSSGVFVSNRSNGAVVNVLDKKESGALAGLSNGGDAASCKLMFTSLEAKLDQLIMANRRHSVLLEKAISKMASPWNGKKLARSASSLSKDEEPPISKSRANSLTSAENCRANSLTSAEEFSASSPSEVGDRGDPDTPKRAKTEEALEEKHTEETERSGEGSPCRQNSPQRLSTKQTSGTKEDSRTSPWISEDFAKMSEMPSGEVKSDGSPKKAKNTNSTTVGERCSNIYEHLGATSHRRPSVVSLCSQKSTGSLTSFCSSTIVKTVQFASKRNPLLHHIWRFMEEPASVKYGTTYVILMDSTIILSVLFAFLQLTEETLQQSLIIRGIELAFDIIFTLETLLFFISCPNHLLFFADLYNIIDVFAGLPPLILRIIVLTSSTQTFNDTADSILLCAVPVLRLLKFMRRFEKFHLLLKAFKLLIDALPVLLYTLAVILLAFSAFLYLVEPRSNIPTLGWSLYATLLTLTTVGYGDVVPKSSLGQLLVCCLSIVSTLYLAIPLGIIGSAFSSVWEDRDRVLLLQRTRTQLREMGLGARDIPSLFRFFDKDMDGQLSLGEFRQMVHEMKLGISPRRIIELFRLMDKDDSGSIDDAEFMRTLFPVTHASIYRIGKMSEELEAYESETSNPPGSSTSC